ncbi:MAG: molecular chaperone DnaJ [Chloroflexota bacterium]
MAIADQDLTADPTGAGLASIAAQLADAAWVEDVFGQLAGTTSEMLDQLRRRYWRIALAVHPDRHRASPAASEAFVTLQRLHARAQELVRAGQYGARTTPAAPIVITTRKHEYVVGSLLAQGDLASLYRCTASDGRQAQDAVLKVARDGADNDLLANEARTLRLLHAPTDGRPVPAYLPRLLEAFLYDDGTDRPRQANAFALAMTESGPLPADGFYSLAEVRAHYREGVDPKQMAWIWRRLSIALGYAHERGVVHGAVLPTHILIHPKEHALLLVDWAYSVHQPDRTDERIAAIVADYERWYPTAVLTKRLPGPAVDLEMGLRCMVYLLGGDPLTGALPATVPAQIHAYLRGPLLTGAQRTSAARLYHDFSQLLAGLWGQRRFVPFSMPARH